MSQTLTLLTYRRWSSHFALKIFGMFFVLYFLIPLLLLFLFIAHSALLSLFLRPSQTYVVIVKPYILSKQKYDFLSELRI